MEGTTFAGDVAALRVFYGWAARRWGYSIWSRPVRTSTCAGGANIKLLDRGRYLRWRDLGVRGLDRAGRPAAGWGRNEQRDAGFVDGLYRSGLRLSG